MRKKTKQLVLIGICVIIILIASVLIISLNKTKTIYLTFGDDTHNWRLFNRNTNIEISSNKAFEGYNIVFYLSSDCKSCIQKLPSIEIVNSILCDDAVESYVIWRKSVPSNLIKTTQQNNYSLHGIELMDTFPYYYIIEDNNVTFMTHDINSFIKKTLKDVGEENVQYSIINWLRKNFNIKSDCLRLIFVDDVMDINEINSSDIILAISYDNNERCIYDPEGLVASVFGITKYPSILSIDSRTMKIEGLDDI